MLTRHTLLNSRRTKARLIAHLGCEIVKQIENELHSDSTCIQNGTKTKANIQRNVFLYVHKCTHVYECIGSYVCVYVYTFIPLYTCMHLSVCTCKYVNMCICRYICTCSFINMCIYTCECIWM